MNNKEYIAILAQKGVYNQKDTQKLVRTVIDAMTDSFGEGDTVSIPGFGTFEVRKRLERIVVNPTTKKKMLVPPKLLLGFKPVQSIKNQLKNSSNKMEGGEDE